MSNSMADKTIINFENYEIPENIMGDALYYCSLRRRIGLEEKREREITVGRSISIPIYGYTRTLKYSEGVGIDGINYSVMYASSAGHPHTRKEIVISRNRFIRAYQKWIKKSWINKWETQLQREKAWKTQ